MQVRPIVTMYNVRPSDSEETDSYHKVKIIFIETVIVIILYYIIVCTPIGEPLLRNML